MTPGPQPSPNPGPYPPRPEATVIFGPNGPQYQWNPAAPSYAAPAPAPTPTVSRSPWPVYLLVAGALFLGYRYVETLRDRPAPGPGPIPAPASVDGQKLGRSFVAPLAASLADAMTVEADALEAGKTLADAHAAMVQAFKDGRDRAFSTLAAPAFASVVPDGSEPKDQAQRAAAIALRREFAKGLKGGGK